MDFHPQFLEGSFEMNTAAILQAIVPVVASKTTDESEFSRACKNYLAAYGAYLGNLSERDFIVALSKAGRVLRKQEEVSHE